MSKMQQRFTFLLLIVLFFSPLQIADATTTHISKMDAYQMLQSGHSDAVRTLPKGEREILLATFEMNRGKTTEALKYLNSKQVEKKNRLAALIKAEAYRRQSVQAADRAGHYAHAVNDDIGTLKKARITTGLDEANVRLDAFLVRLNTPKPVIKKPAQPVKPIRVAVVEHVNQLKPVKIAMLKSAPATRVVTVAKAIPAVVSSPMVRYQPSMIPQPAVIALAQPLPKAHQELKVKVIASKPVRLKLAQLEPSKIKVFATTTKQKPASSVAYPQRSTVAPTAFVQHVDRLESVRQAIDTWRNDWNSLNSKAYLSHYDKAFKTLKHDYVSWVKYKRRVNGKKTYIKVSISDLKIIPGSEQLQGGDAVLVTFNQRYQSSNYNAVSRKQLYMARKNNAAPWLILYEGDNS